MTGNEYRRLVARHLVRAYGDRGVVVYEEVPVGLSIIGKRRRIDLFVHVPSQNRALALECKYQDSLGTVDEKIPYALQDLAALRMPAALVYAGSGFSSGVLHLLQCSELAAHCLPTEPEPTPAATWQLDHVVALTFEWWDLLVGHRKPFTLPREPQGEPALLDPAQQPLAIDDPAPLLD